MDYFKRFLLSIGIVAGILIPATLLFAETEDINELNSEISDKKSSINKLDSRIDEYRKKINELTGKTANLLNDLQIIENQIALTELDVESTRLEIETQQIEINVLQKRIVEQTAEIENQKAMMREMLFELHQSSNTSIIEVFFGSESFNDLFAQIDRLESVNTDLNKSFNATKLAKETLEENKASQELKLKELEGLEDELNNQVAIMHSNQEAKNRLIDITQDSESEYRVLMSELRQEQQYVTNQILTLQAEVEQRIAENSEDGEEIDMSNPGLMIPPVDRYVVTATFHDPTYPFRHLFEHSGIDLAAPIGTPIKATAPGVVAWTRTGRSYGNYIMVIHQGGFASLYAHMTRFNVVADQYVGRGQVIGFMGSTGLSTGSHVHFEVRINGIPVNPASYVNFK